MTPATGSWFLDAEEALDRTALSRLQETRLLEMARYAYQHSALLRMVWDQAGIHPRDVRSLQDFTDRAPFIDQDSLREYRARTGDPYAGTLCVDVGDLGYLGMTSGTTGNPTPLAHCPHGPTETARGRELWMLGARPGDRVAVFMFTFRSGIDLLLERAPELGIQRIFLQHGSAGVPALFEATRRFSPSVLYLVSSPAIMAIDDYATRAGIDVREAFSCYRAVVYGGEALGSWARERLSAWGLTVVQMTAAGDALPATECLERNGCHVWEDQVFVEQLETGGTEPATSGRGELVVTSLTDQASPLLRFRTGDVVTTDSTTCACGRSHVRIRTLGRTNDLLHVRGRALLPADIAPALSGFPACRGGFYQVVLPAKGPAERLTVRVGFDGTGGHTLQEQIAASIAARLEVPVDVTLVHNDELLAQGPPHKIPRTVRA
jgi:phenylacetate-CoA ligase